MVRLARRVVLKVDSILAVECASLDRPLRIDVDEVIGGLKNGSHRIRRIMEQDAWFASKIRCAGRAEGR